MPQPVNIAPPKKVKVHFMVDDPNAVLPYSMKTNTATGTVTSGKCRQACDPEIKQRSYPKHATVEPESVTCPTCLASDEWKAARVALAEERDEEPDPAWLPAKVALQAQPIIPAPAPVAAPILAPPKATT